MGAPDLVSTGPLRSLAAGVEMLGLPADALLAAVGLTWEDLRVAGRLPHGALFALWERAPRYTGDASFGLHAAEFLQLHPFELGEVDLVDYAARASRTLGEALGRVARYQRLLRDELFELRVEVAAEEVRIVPRLPGVPLGGLRHAAECALATMLLRARALTAIDFSPREVWFEHSAPADTREHRRIFRAPLRFEQTCHALVLDRGLLDHPLVTADSRLCALLDRQAQDLLARLPRESSVSDRTRRLLREVLRGGDAGVAAIARRLGMSPRSLQRRLAAEGSSYRGLLDEVRREIAVRHLGERDLAISEVASALGFSDATGFYRAFRRWTGASPAGYRARGAGPGVAVARSA